MGLRGKNMNLLYENLFMNYSYEQRQMHVQWTKIVVLTVELNLTYTTLPWTGYNYHSGLKTWTHSRKIPAAYGD